MSSRPVNMIVAHMGYAEDSFAGSFIVMSRADEPFETPLEALNDLAHCFLLKYCQEENLFSKQRECCREFKQRAQPEDERCPKCGNKLGVKALDFSGLCAFIYEHHTRTMDGYGDPLGELGPWDEFVSIRDILGTPADQIIELAPNAERIIPLALRGNEFDAPRHPWHPHAEALRLGVKNYWEGHDWIENDPEDFDDFARILESYRASNPK